MITTINEFKKINESIYNGPLTMEDKIELKNRFKKYIGYSITFKNYVKTFDNEDDAQREIDHFLDGYCPDNIDYEDALDYVYIMCGWNVNMKSDYNLNENSSSDLVKKYNDFMDFINNKIDYILSREGELSDSYFEKGLEERMNNLINNIKTVQDIIDNNDEFEYVYAKLIDGYNGLNASGTY